MHTPVPETHFFSAGAGLVPPPQLNPASRKESLQETVDNLAEIPAVLAGAGGGKVSKRKGHVVPDRCECGRPNVRAGQPGTQNASGCERCKRLEAETERDLAGVNGVAAERRDPLWRAGREIDRACDRWLREKGL